MVVKAGGPVCGCGARGRLEAVASRTAIVRRVRKAIRKGIPTTLKNASSNKDARLKSKELAAAAAIGDSVAVKEIHRAATFLGLGLASVINFVGPELVIVGGGVAEALALLISISSAPPRIATPSAIPTASSPSSPPNWATTPASWARPCWRERRLNEKEWRLKTRNSRCKEVKMKNNKHERIF